ncbi:ankyrin repeat domain-containing protein [Flagellimonas meishanensis]|uniref:ankyrin repeat domain-containing protein n=1 Tax=Flagellimonas meishanensis TaxID=2873264 RepID=UPI001CA72F54|nr:ankyrin repeat domain-containing protein [[Muricauda] meishanensis]
MKELSRSSFLKTSGLVIAGCAITPLSAKSVFFDNEFNSVSNDLFSLEEIKEFVFAAHSDFEKTKRIIEDKPLILNCTNQAQRGDFETAIGGAAHMGRKDIADLLLSKGAVMDIFSMTFFGHIEMVKQLIGLNPQLLNAPGPHGFTLLHHAKMGKHKEFESWLIEKGLVVDMFKDFFK